MKATQTAHRLHLSLALHDNALSLGEIREAILEIVSFSDLDITADDLSQALAEAMRKYPTLTPDDAQP